MQDFENLNCHIKSQILSSTATWLLVPLKVAISLCLFLRQYWENIPNSQVWTTLNRLVFLPSKEGLPRRVSNCAPSLGFAWEQRPSEGSLFHSEQYWRCVTQGLRWDKISISLLFIKKILIALDKCMMLKSDCYCTLVLLPCFRGNTTPISPPPVVSSYHSHSYCCGCKFTFRTSSSDSVVSCWPNT